MPSRRDDIQGVNEAYALELYERYRSDPRSVDEATRNYFDASAPESGTEDTGVQTGTGRAAGSWDPA